MSKIGILGCDQWLDFQSFLRCVFIINLQWDSTLKSIPKWARTHICTAFSLQQHSVTTRSIREPVFRTLYSPSLPHPCNLWSLFQYSSEWTQTQSGFPLYPQSQTGPGQTVFPFFPLKESLAFRCQLHSKESWIPYPYIQTWYSYSDETEQKPAKNIWWTLKKLHVLEIQ